ncbi:hypothetical protein [Pseudobdellovibrio exovorus]|uniref:Uncharacterized protein n=1 Tax=Pseudobdellovibrio exovorus JSS TaxID=1184267 RepID=M4VE36_9BACT|nr:hypothetical protein [Pseudobdellovibrio exovorus]AGH96755.1 hypothetical protein A11Q_2539 [Pseudobdellovibrio exovorus JSS]
MMPFFIVVVLLYALSPYRSGDSSRSYGTMPCAVAESINSEISIFFSILFAEKICHVTYKIQGRSEEKKKLSTACPVAHKPKQIFIKNIEAAEPPFRQRLVDIDAINDLRCVLPGPYQIHGGVSFIPYEYTDMNVGFFFDMLKEDEKTVEHLEQQSFRLIKTEGNVWSFHLYPAIEVNVEVDERTKRIIRLINTERLFLVENDAGEIISLKKPTSIKDIKIFGIF